MLFNSYDFSLLFLPLTLLGFYLLARLAGARAAAAWLALASLFFYGYWAPRYLLLLCGSVVVNYGFGVEIAKRRETDAAQARLLLLVAIFANLGALAYFKYVDFLVASLNAVTGIGLALPQVLLPIGISFFSFTQIAFLVDAFRGIAREYRFMHYVLFVTYFPHLIAGPVLHHADMMPQFSRAETYSPRLSNLTGGLFFFVAGLVKKVVLADTFAEYASPVFNAADAGFQPSFLVAWSGTLAYTLQLYFDFSGYSDMAIGLSRMFGIDIPINFNSPYRSTSIIEFWRRWHMTLSKFLRDYLYIPLGGNRDGAFRRHINLMVTMLLGGLWHGANWTFVVWGGLHGAYIVVAHVWQSLLARSGRPAATAGPARLLAGWALTLLCVMVAWVFFRSTSFVGAWRMLRAMFDASGLVDLVVAWPSFERAFVGVAVPPDSWAVWLSFLATGCALAFLGPNTQTLVQSAPVARLLSGRAGAAALGLLLTFCLLLLAINASRGASEFIYFNF